MQITDRLALIWGAASFAGAGAQTIARFTGLPAVVLLLAVGLLVGHAGFDWIQPEILGRGLEPLVGLLVSLVLFDGGLKLRLAGRELQRSVLQLVLVRSLLGFAGAAVLAYALTGLDLSLSLVYAAIALATGPTVVTPLVQEMGLDASLGSLLEAEGLILEPVGAVLALLLLQLAIGSLDSWTDVLSRLLLRLGGGVAAGCLAGLLLSLLLSQLPPAPPEEPADAGAPPFDGLPLQLSLGVLFLLFSGCEAVLPESGFPAVVSAGVVVGLRQEYAATELDRAIRQLAMLAITVLFPLLAADVSWTELSPLGLGGVACVLGLTLVRGLVVALAGLGLPSLDWREKLLVSWVAPRGIVTAAVASLFALQLDAAGVAGAGSLKGLVFLTILITVGLQGFTAPWLARRLGLSGVAQPAPAPPSAPPTP
ncbi:cation:proton antiporter [Cyanobium sp. FGCU-52]|nr:cation:proton antiporter [Cyanobium sp. FGCU52]